MRTENREQTDRQRIQLQRSLLSPVDRQGERANIHIFTNDYDHSIIIEIVLKILRSILQIPHPSFKPMECYFILIHRFN